MKISQYTFVKRESWLKLIEAFNEQQNQIKSAAEFVKAIEQGNLDVSFKQWNAHTTDNMLVSSLESMRNQMKKFSTEEKQRTWVTEGLARFVEILRSKNDDTAALADNIIRHLVKYMNANQGALYILNDETEDVHIEMVACYAYDRKKYLTKKIALGEGLAGQAVLEKQTVHMTNIPDHFLKITSGLGEALPRNLLIVPLKIDEHVLGLVEIASFHTMKDYQIQFLERLGESIASSLSAVKVNQRTKKLLEESQARAEEMRAQEEEMRQNMEELSATQEEMHRILKEVQGKEAFMTDLINATNDIIITIDKNYKIVICNKPTVDNYKSIGLNVGKGFYVLDLYSEDQKAVYRKYYDRALAGEYFEVTESKTFRNKEQYFSVTYSPLRNEKGEVTGAAAFGKDITETINEKIKTETLMAEAQHDAEELKAQEEELRQNMEELSATQEEMHRILKEVQGRETFMTDLINATHDTIITIDRNYKIIICNQETVDNYKTLGLNVGKGFNVLDLYGEDQKSVYKKYYDRALDREYFEVTEAYTFRNKEQYFAVTYCPLRNEKGEVTGAAAFGKDITEAINEKIRSETLMAEAQHQTEELKAQEEELRQNMEELSATQEEMHRVLKEVQGRETFMTDLINATHDTIITVDKNYKIIICNQVTIDNYQTLGFNVSKGFNVLDLYGEDQKGVYKKYYDRAFDKEYFEVTESYTFGKNEQYFAVTYCPLRNEKGEVTGAAAFGKDITEAINEKIRSETLMAEAQHQAEELKAQEEQLRQNMEELSTTQEEMHRILKEMQSKEAFLNDLLNATTDLIITIDKNYRIITCNKATYDTYKALGMEVDKGFDVLNLVTDEQKPAYKKYYNRAFKGERFEITENYKFKDKEQYFTTTYGPLRNEKGEITGATVFTKDITETIIAKLKAEKPLKESKEIK